VSPPSEVAPGVPQIVDAIVMRGLAREQSERFSTAREMAVALERSGLPIAPSSVIGEWVESLASEKLSVRASRIAEIESSTHLLPAPPPSSRSRLQSFGSLPTPAAATQVRAEPEALPTAGVYTSPTLNSQILTHPKGRRALLAAFLAAGVLGGALIVMSKVKSEKAETVTAAAASAPASTLAAPAEPVPEPPLPAPEAKTPAPPPSAPPAKPTSTSTSTAVAAKASPPPAKAPPAAPVAASKKGDCSPPYTLDKEGIRHIKPGCL
jgi:serine/threonine-protein kinase